jgi:hypothetical protein
MNLYFHELTHVVLSVLVGTIIWQRLHTNISVFFAAFIGGFLIDLDHLLDYFLAFGAKFNLTYFLKGYAFLKTDKIYVFFHSWELVIIFFLLFLLLSNNSFPTFKPSNLRTIQILLFSFSLSLFLHLSVDAFTNNMKPQSYFLLYRVHTNFELKKLVTGDHYTHHLKVKYEMRNLFQ